MSEHDLDIIDQPGNCLEFNGRQVTIKPLKVGQLPAFARAIKPIAGALERIDSITAAELLDLIADHGEHIVDAISIASGISKDELNDASPIDLLAIVTPIIKANADFFHLRLALTGKLTATAGAMMAAAGAGQTR